LKKYFVIKNINFFLQVRSGRQEVDRQLNQERRYNDLKAMAEKLWKKNGLTGDDAFDERKYWAYGCHCYLLGKPLVDQTSFNGLR
jgi:hypothetical protein